MKVTFLVAILSTSPADPVNSFPFESMEECQFRVASLNAHKEHNELSVTDYPLLVCTTTHIETKLSSDSAFMAKLRDRIGNCELARQPGQICLIDWKDRFSVYPYNLND